jgi:hypothetical protein
LKESISQLPGLAKRLYEIVEAPEGLFPGRRFTLDGHLVGSLGEVWAAYLYGLQLAPASQRTHDATGPDGRMVQVKATQGSSVPLSSCPDHLIVLRLSRDGPPEEIYNGPGQQVWDACGKLGTNGQRRIQVSTLRALMGQVPIASRLAQVAT